MFENKGCCHECEVFRNFTDKEFAWGFFCPIKNKFVERDDDACEFILADGLNF